MYRSAGFTQYAGLCGLVSKQEDPAGSGRIDQIGGERMAVVREWWEFLKNHNSLFAGYLQDRFVVGEADPVAGEFADSGFQGFHPGYQPIVPIEPVSYLLQADDVDP